MRQYKREVDRAVRELDRERVKLERQNDKLAADIRKAAKENQTKVVKILAKDYVRGKKHIQKFLQLRTWLQGVGIQLQVSECGQSPHAITLRCFCQYILSWNVYCHKNMCRL